MTEEVRSAPAPLLMVTRGAPTPEELAALVVVFATRPAAASASGGRPGRSEWSAKSRALRATVRPGPGAWRASALPG